MIIDKVNKLLEIESDKELEKEINSLSDNQKLILIKSMIKIMQTDKKAIGLPILK